MLSRVEVARRWMKVLSDPNDTAVAELVEVLSSDLSTNLVGSSG